jgi:hypothetical protein
MARIRRIAGGIIHSKITTLVSSIEIHIFIQIYGTVTGDNYLDFAS